MRSNSGCGTTLVFWSKGIGSTNSTTKLKSVHLTGKGKSLNLPRTALKVSSTLGANVACMPGKMLPVASKARFDRIVVRFLTSLALLTLLRALGTTANAATPNIEGWFPFDPKPDPFSDSPIDLRFLNEKFAGEHGFIAAKAGHFIHSANGQPVRFWAVNGPSREDADRADLRRTARLLANYGV